MVPTYNPSTWETDRSPGASWLDRQAVIDKLWVQPKDVITMNEVSSDGGRFPASASSLHADMHAYVCVCTYIHTGTHILKHSHT